MYVCIAATITPASSWTLDDVVPPYWYAPYNQRTIACELSDIEHWRHMLLDFMHSPSTTDDAAPLLFWRGYMDDEHARRYVHQAISVECACPNLTLADVEQHLIRRQHDIDHRLALKCLNVYDALMWGMGDAAFTPNLARHYHTLVAGRGLMADGGVYRTIHVKPAGSDYTYLEPSRIADHMERLFATTTTVMIRPGQMIPTPLLLDQVKLAAVFYVRFLSIHPFRNGNGRVARLLLSHLLQAITIAPLSLLGTRAVYIECMEDARYGQPPHNLARLILESIHTHFHVITQALEL
jgi:Fic/DOC family